MKKIEIVTVYDPAISTLNGRDWEEVQAALIAEFGNALLDARKVWEAE